MIRVISTPDNYPYIIRCFKCHNKFKFQNIDIHEDKINQIDFIYRINCPICGQDINSWTKDDWLKRS